MATYKPFKVIAPGRVCLFGEHSDYLGLDVIPCAINLAIEIQVVPRKDDMVNIKYLDFGRSDSFSLFEPIEYTSKRDYVRSAFNVLMRANIRPKFGADLTVRGDLPISAGLSSSSALTIAAILVAAKLSGHFLDARTLATLAFHAEVLEFGESGGNQDHLASAYGGMLYLDYSSTVKVTRLPAKLSGLIIGDSQEKKRDTVGDLKRIRETVETGYSFLSQVLPNFNRRTTPLEIVDSHITSLPPAFRKMTLATLRNRDITYKARRLLENDYPNPLEIGALLNAHHSLLRDGLGRSTSKIEYLIDAALNAGAFGCKINGSGGGGTILAYAPNNETNVIKALEDAGGVPYQVRIGPAATVLPV